MKRKFTCPICKINPCRKTHRYCNPCHAKKMREWRKTNPQNDEQRKKSNCRSYSNTYLKRGKIIKEPCLICGDNKSQIHHSDYNKPLLITWYCRKHHLEFHKNRVRGF